MQRTDIWNFPQPLGHGADGEAHRRDLLGRRRVTARVTTRRRCRGRDRRVAHVEEALPLRLLQTEGVALERLLAIAPGMPREHLRQESLQILPRGSFAAARTPAHHAVPHPIRKIPEACSLPPTPSESTSVL